MFFFIIILPKFQFNSAKHFLQCRHIGNKVTKDCTWGCTIWANDNIMHHIYYIKPNPNSLVICFSSIKLSESSSKQLLFWTKKGVNLLVETYLNYYYGLLWCGHLVITLATYRSALLNLSDNYLHCCSLITHFDAHCVHQQHSLGDKHM